MRVSTSTRRYASERQQAVAPRQIERRRRASVSAIHIDYQSAVDRIRARGAIGEVLGRLGLRFEIVTVTQARDSAEEAVELRSDGGSLSVRLALDRLASPSLRRFLYHELGHVLDMTDPAFCYRPRLPRAVATGGSIRDRVELLWDCVVDGRTDRLGEVPIATRQDRGEQFLRLFPELPWDIAESVVGLL